MATQLIHTTVMKRSILDQGTSRFPCHSSLISHELQLAVLPIPCKNPFVNQPHLTTLFSLLISTPFSGRICPFNSNGRSGREPPISPQINPEFAGATFGHFNPFRNESIMLSPCTISSRTPRGYHTRRTNDPMPWDWWVCCGIQELEG